MSAARALIVFSLLPLAACSREAKDAPAPDPMIAAAIAASLMSDPDLSALNRAGVALTGTGVPSAPIPTDETSEEFKSAALDEATRLAGGALKPAPSAASDDKVQGGETALLSWGKAFARKACMAKAAHGFIWAARLPAPFAVIPRGHVQEAAGSDDAGCVLRAVTFRSALAPQVVLDFYATRASVAGFRPEHRADGDFHVLEASKGGTGFALFVRSGPDGLTEADLLTRAQ